MGNLALFHLVAAVFTMLPSRKDAALNPETIRRLARLSTSLFLPALIFSNLVKRLDLGSLTELWPVPFFAVMHIAVSLCVGWCFMLIARPPKYFRRVFVV